MIRNSIIIAVVLSIMISPLVLADVIVPGTKSVSWCYEISNVDDYPDYVFVYNEERVSGHGVISNDDCFSFYKNGLTSVYAIKKIEFDETELNREFFTDDNPKLINSDIQLNAYGLVDENDPLEKVVTTLQINSMSGNELDIQKSEITFTYNDGTSEVETFQSQDITPEPSKKAIIPFWIAQFWFIVPILAAIIIAAILLSRRKK